MLHGLHGQDISAWQNAIPKGQDFVIIKATEGTDYENSHFADWWQQLHGHRRGAYHFAHPANSAEAEADYFLSVVKPVAGDVLVLDFETDDGMSPDHCSAWAFTWCMRVHAKSGIQPVLYTDLAMAWAGCCASLGAYPLWIADPSRSAGRPRVPAPWNTWVLHQYGFDPDLDILNGDSRTWAKLGNGHVPVPGPAPAFPGRNFMLEDPYMSGPDIRTWQTRMAVRGWAITVDGIYGPESQGICKAFQSEKHLTVDGIVGPITWKAAWEYPIT